MLSLQKSFMLLEGTFTVLLKLIRTLREFCYIFVTDSWQCSCYSYHMFLLNITSQTVSAHASLVFCILFNVCCQFFVKRTILQCNTLLSFVLHLPNKTDTQHLENIGELLIYLNSIQACHRG